MQFDEGQPHDFSQVMAGDELLKDALTGLGRPRIVFFIKLGTYKVQTSFGAKVAPTRVDDDVFGAGRRRFPRAHFGGGLQVTSVGPRAEYDADAAIKI